MISGLDADYGGAQRRDKRAKARAERRDEKRKALREARKARAKERDAAKPRPTP